MEEQGEVANKAYAEIAKAKLELEGAQFAPDATFTLRLSYGTVEGYEEDGKTFPAFTDIAGLYQWADQHENRSPFQVPTRWKDKRTAMERPVYMNGDQSYQWVNHLLAKCGPLAPCSTIKARAEHHAKCERSGRDRERLE